MVWIYPLSPILLQRYTELWYFLIEETLSRNISEFLPERNIHKRHKKYLGIKAPGAMLQIE